MQFNSECPIYWTTLRNPTHPPAMTRPHKQAGFTLIELVVVVSILSILAGAITPMMQKQLLKARDARRITDIQAVCEAIDNYYADTGTWPAANANPSFGGWDVSHDGNFIGELRAEGYLLEDVRDPTNDATFHYRYYVYNQGSFNCQGETSFYVIGIRNFETEDYENKNVGYFQCSGRNWGDEFAYVTGGGASN